MLVLWILLGLLVLALVIALIVGARLPVGHRATGAITVAASPEAVHALLSDVERTPTWRADVKTVELLGERDGRRRYREIGKNGVVPYEVLSSDPGARLVVAIADDKLPYGGTWTWTLTDEVDGCRVTLTEDGQVFNVLFRFLARYVFGHTKTIDEVFAALAAHFERLGADPAPPVDPEADPDPI